MSRCRITDSVGVGWLDGCKTGRTEAGIMRVRERERETEGGREMYSKEVKGWRMWMWMWMSR